MAALEDLGRAGKGATSVVSHPAWKSARQSSWPVSRVVALSGLRSEYSLLGAPPSSRETCVPWPRIRPGITPRVTAQNRRAQRKYTRLNDGQRKARSWRAHRSSLNGNLSGRRRLEIIAKRMNPRRQRALPWLPLTGRDGDHFWGRRFRIGRRQRPRPRLNSHRWELALLTCHEPTFGFPHDILNGLGHTNVAQPSTVSLRQSRLCHAEGRRPTEPTGSRTHRSINEMVTRTASFGLRLQRAGFGAAFGRTSACARPNRPRWVNPSVREAGDGACGRHLRAQSRGAR